MISLAELEQTTKLGDAMEDLQAQGMVYDTEWACQESTPDGLSLESKIQI